MVARLMIIYPVCMLNEYDDSNESSMKIVNCENSEEII